MPPDSEMEASTGQPHWRHLVRSAIENLHIRRKLISLDEQSHLYALVDRPEDKKPFGRLPVHEKETEETATGQGYVQDSKKKRIVEEHAMKEAEKYFSGKGYDVERHAGGRKYDLVCKGKGDLFVEVKGTTSKGRGVLMTAGEVKYAKHHEGSMALYVLHSVTYADGKASGGQELVKLPWIVDESKLGATHYLLKLD